MFLRLSPRSPPRLLQLPGHTLPGDTDLVLRKLAGKWGQFAIAHVQEKHKL